MTTRTTRDDIYDIVNHAIALERGVALDCCRVEDPQQLAHVLAIKKLAVALIAKGIVGENDAGGWTLAIVEAAV